MRPAARRSLALVLSLAPVVAFAAAPAPPRPVVATVETTLPTSPGRIRQLAFDGDPKTYFSSERKPTADDHFTLVLDQPVAVKSLAVSTGLPDGDYALG